MMNNWKIATLFIFFWFGVLVVTGTLSSGFHFTDDHDILSLKKDLSDTSVPREIKLFTKEIFASKLRFRPFYVMSRRAAGAFFGSDFFAWSVYTAILAILTSFFLFVFMRKTGFSLAESLFFVGFTLVGEQAAIWWKLGANETVGMFMLSIALLFMIKKGVIPNILFVFFTILASWSKESFVLVIPELIIWKILLDRQNEKGMWDAIKKNLATSVILILACLWEMVHILTSVSMTKVRYGGGKGFQPATFFKTAIDSVMAVEGWVIVILLAVTGFIFYKTRKTPPLWPFILGGAILGPQIILYMQSGIYERYLLPGVIGIALIIAALLKYIREYSEHSEGKKIMSMSKIEIIVVILLCAVFLNQLRITRYTAVGFAHEGKYTNEWLRSIDQNVNPADVSLVVIDPVTCMEASYSIQKYMDMEMNRENILFSPVHLNKIRESNRRFWDDINNTFFSRFKDFSLDNIENKNLIRAILIFPGLEKKFLNYFGTRFNPGQFKRYSNPGGFVSYYKIGGASIP